MSRLFKLVKNLFRHRHRWKTVRTIWPYPDGYADYCEGCGRLIDFRKEP